MTPDPTSVDRDQNRPWLDLEPPQPRESSAHVAQLAARLYLASREAGRRALSRFIADEDHDLIEAAQSAGAATEYLLRAVLALHDPALLADRRSPASVVALSRANPGAELDIGNLRTINYGEALQLLRIVHPALTVDADVQFIMQIRNAAAHMAMTSSRALKDVAVRLVQVVSKVHGHLNREEERYWGDELGRVVIAMKDERADDLARTVEAKLARARQLLTQLTRDLTPGDAEAVLIAREARPVRWLGEEDEPQECPVCNRSGWFEVASEKGTPYEYEYSDDSFWGVETHRWPTMFQCPVCDLVLGDYDEVVEAGLPVALESRHETTEDPRLGPDPDEDYWRGR